MYREMSDVPKDIIEGYLESYQEVLSRRKGVGREGREEASGQETEAPYHNVGSRSDRHRRRDLGPRSGI